VPDPSRDMTGVDMEEVIRRGNPETPNLLSKTLTESGGVTGCEIIDVRG
jgi:hypothetical protein